MNWEWGDDNAQEVNRDMMDAYLKALEEKLGHPPSLEEKIIAEELFNLNSQGG